MENIIYNPTNARKNLYQIIKDVNHDHVPVTIKSQKANSDAAVILSEKDWNAIQETLYLTEHGVNEAVNERQKDNSGWTNVDDLDWDNL